MDHLGLFEGIGGFSLAARWMGWETKAWCEINPFCQQVLKHHFPEAEGYTDIKQTDFTKYANTIDVLTGGFPCQPYSQAGKRLGKEDERHLWPEMLRAIREVSPSWVVGENVSGLLNWSRGLVFDEVQADLENEGYEITPFLLPACGKGAPHKRERIWFIAFNTELSTNGRYNPRKGKGKGMGMAGDVMETTGREQGANDIKPSDYNGATTNATLQRERSRSEEPGENERGGEQLERAEQGSDNHNNGISGISGNAERERLQRGGRKRQGLKQGYWDNWPQAEPTIRSRNDGFSNGLDGITFSKWREESIKAYGNAIVPQVAFEIFKAIDLFDCA